MFHNNCENGDFGLFDKMLSHIEERFGHLLHKVEHVRFDGAVHHGQVLAVVQGVEHGDFQRGALGDRRFARLEVHLHAVLFGEGLQACAERIQA